MSNPFHNLILMIAMLVNPTPFVYERAVQPTYTIKRIEVPEERREATQEEWDNCQCVPYVRQFIPNLPRGDAKYQDLNSYPVEGGAVIFRDSHIGFISRIWGNVIEVKHRYLKRKSDTEFECITTTDWYGFNSEKFKGFAEY